MKIYFVCTGNTCRSPMAEIILKNKLKLLGKKGVSVGSFGIMTVQGQRTEDKAVEALKNIGLSAKKRPSKQLDCDLMSSADFVICMTNSHKTALKNAGFGNVFTLGELTGTGDVSDPYGGSQEVYNLTALKLSAALDLFVEKYL